MGRRPGHPPSTTARPQGGAQADAKTPEEAGRHASHQRDRQAAVTPHSLRARAERCQSFKSALLRSPRSLAPTLAIMLCPVILPATCVVPSKRAGNFLEITANFSSVFRSACRTESNQARAEVDMARMTRRLAVSLDKIRALGHVAFVHTYRSSDDKRSSLATWLVLHLQEAYCKT